MNSNIKIQLFIKIYFNIKFQDPESITWYHSGGPLFEISETELKCYENRKFLLSFFLYYVNF